MRISQQGICGAIAFLILTACSGELPTNSTAVPSFIPGGSISIGQLSNLVGGTTICSAGGQNGWFAIPATFWVQPIVGSTWVGPTGTSDIDHPRLAIENYSSGFAVPGDAYNIQVSGHVLADNDVEIRVNGTLVYNSNPGAQAYVVDGPDPRTYPNFQTEGGIAFNGTPTTGANTVVFTVLNDDNPNTAPAGFNPFGLSFCYDVTWETPDTPPEAVAMFVVGDVEPHAVGDNVNFWGAQWWKNNFMSGLVSNGVAAFKGYATLSDNVCGGTWVSLPGNSSNPPATIPAKIAVIVTSKVLKVGPNISGDIRQIVMVDQDGGYGPNPGHRGNGPVSSIVCTAP